MSLESFLICFIFAVPIGEISSIRRYISRTLLKQQAHIMIHNDLHCCTHPPDLRLSQAAE